MSIIFRQISCLRLLGARLQLALWASVPSGLPCAAGAVLGATQGWGWSGISIQPTLTLRTISSNHSFNQFHPAVSWPASGVDSSCSWNFHSSLTLHQREEHTIILTLAATAWDPGIWRSKKINSRVIYCDALLAEDAGSQAVNGLLALKQHQLNGNGLDGRPGC